MKICFPTIEYPPETAFGGISTFTYNAARLLARRGHQVTVISSALYGLEGSRKAVEGVDVWRIQDKVYPQRLRDDLRRNRQVWQAVSEVKPDLVQLSEYLAEGFLTSVIPNGNYKLVTRLSSSGTLTGRRREGAASLRKTCLAWMATRQVKRCQALFSPSYTWARLTEQDAGLKPGSVRRIITGLNQAEMKRIKEREPYLRIEKPYIIYFGRLEEHKGLTYLARALPAVWAKFPQLKVVLAGHYEPYYLSGYPARAFIEQQAGKFASNLIFTGRLDRADALSLLPGAEVAVLPSIWEPFAHTCMEALAMGVPVITTKDSGGNAEIIGKLHENDEDSDPAGWLIPRRNVPALAGAIIEALSDEEKLAGLRVKAARRGRCFDAEIMVDELEALYREVLEEN